MSNENQAKFSDTQPRNEELESCDGKLQDLYLGKQIVIKSFNLAQIGANQCAIITTADGKKVSTFSAVIIDQLKAMENDFLNQGTVVNAKLVKEKQYFKFVDV